MAKFKSDLFMKNTKSGLLFTYNPARIDLPDMVVCDAKGNTVSKLPAPAPDGGPDTPEAAFEQATKAPATRKSAASRLASLPQE